MLIYGDAFMAKNAQALETMRAQMGEAAYAVAIETGPQFEEPSDEEETPARPRAKRSPRPPDKIGGATIQWLTGISVDVDGKLTRHVFHDPDDGDQDTRL